MQVPLWGGRGQGSMGQAAAFCGLRDVALGTGEKHRLFPLTGARMAKPGQASPAPAPGPQLAPEWVGLDFPTLLVICSRKAAGHCTITATQSEQ